ncbi:hypothetical protein QTJ16_001451 [Diplocarpon rosae]|uniref:Phosphoglycerate mutase n=1 Tax=Diplocarpon rosae TaxID=946125 RepID=A0AAD9WHZ7_9HELO|nr:hypothetical protein QTJ16_001451 [Diplocarpon rosae]PBP22314.1 phosphoglycerate mutase [Diplocarpon rosae]
MGWPPAVIIVVRHGARLDAADKQWHLTSPTPYDPPLTYGGWTQSRALGARIASILRSRETDDEVLAGSEGGARRRRHKVIIHTSPFLRCVQTSAAISAGLAQNPGHTHHRHQKSSSSALAWPKTMHSSPRIRPSESSGSPSLDPMPESACLRFNEQPENIKKSTVRVDAFLGEWLSPDYFEHITPPPGSVMMVAGAKADLLRREDCSTLSHVRDPSATSVGFPGGWGSPVVMAEEKKEDDGLSNLSSLGQSLPRRDRTSSLSNVGSSASRQGHRTSPNLLARGAEHGVYQPPIPAYAISGSDPIPAGYVAHSRDACVDVDYQWDSMREPQNWGNGGDYGEEWSSMHKRFRKGLQQLVGWYSNSDNPGKLSTNSPVYSSVNEDDAEDEETDLVVILVTHGAGCNALIGALTNQPVLLDVGMASLTMAVRKPSPPTSPTTTPSHSRASSRTLSISDLYDVKLVANTEHLRSAASTPSNSRSPSVASLPAFRESFRERYSNNSGSLDGVNLAKARSISTSSNFGSIRRTATIAGSTPRSYNPARQTSIGLWSAPKSEEEHVEEEQEDSMILNFGDDTTIKDEKEQVTPAVVIAERKAPEAEHELEDDEVAPLAGGLWGTPRPPGYAEKIREIAPKRRWTVNERDRASH